MSSTSQCSKCSALLVNVLAHGLCETCYALSTDHQSDNIGGLTQTFKNDAQISATMTAPFGEVANPHDVTKYHPHAEVTSKNPAAVFDDRYEILSSLGSGGMGEVWKAFDRNTERLVAIKYIKSTQFQSIEYNRFLTEARSMANLKHANVLSLYDFSVDPQRPYMVLEFVDGQSLAVKLGMFKKAPMPFMEVARIMEAAARGVQSAHDSQVLHRDLKPSNIMLANDGTVKVLDFGLAKRSPDSGDQLTLANMMVGGTPGFTAPEQIQANGITTSQTDVWGLGATMYALLAGLPPFPTGSENISKVLTEPLTPLRNRRIGIPAALEAVAMKCLEKNPEDRYATAQQVADDLERFQRGEPVLAKKVKLTERMRYMAKTVPRSTWLVLLIVAVVAASGASLAMLPKRSLQESEQDRLRAGQDVIIIGTEHPEDRTFKSYFELNTLGKSVVPGSGSSLLSHTLTLCELSADPGCSQYRIEGEFQFRINETLKEPRGRLPQIGLYFDQRITKLEKYCTLMTFYSMTFRDYDEKARLNDTPPARSAAILRFHAVHLDANGETITHTRQIAAERFISSTQLPTPYKKIAVEIQPDLFRFWWNNESDQTPNYTQTRPKIDKDYSDAMSKPVFRDLVLSGQEKPGWSPRHSLGLYCENAQLGVRNFKISPVQP